MSVAIYQDPPSIQNIKTYATLMLIYRKQEEHIANTPPWEPSADLVVRLHVLRLVHFMN